MPKMIVIRGPSGIGKTTVTHLLWKNLKKRNGNTLHEHVDVYWDALGDSKELAYNEEFDLALENALCVSINCLKTGYDVILEGVIMKDGMLRIRDAVASANVPGTSLHSFFLTGTKETVLKRNAQREGSFRGPDDGVISIHTDMTKQSEVLVGESIVGADTKTAADVAKVIEKSVRSCDCTSGFELCCPHEKGK